MHRGELAASRSRRPARLHNPRTLMRLYPRLNIPDPAKWKWDCNFTTKLQRPVHLRYGGRGGSMTSKKKPFVQFTFPMPSQDDDQSLFTRRFEMRVTNQLEAAVIERADENAGGGKMALMAFMAMQVFRKDQ